MGVVLRSGLSESTVSWLALSSTWIGVPDAALLALCAYDWV